MTARDSGVVKIALLALLVFGVGIANVLTDHKIGQSKGLNRTQNLHLK